jgi:hypothetical protein
MRTMILVLALSAQMFHADLYAAAGKLAPINAALPALSPKVAELTQSEASSGLKDALAAGVKSAITQLGKKDGFLADQAVRIMVPKRVRKLADAAKSLGAGKYVEDFEVAMNRAAEQAVPLAADVFAAAVKQMSVQDALAIVSGEPDAATQYFRRTTEATLQAKFLPIVTKATGNTGVTQRYKALSEKSGPMAALLGGSSKKPLDLDAYVTEKTLDGLFYYVGEQEKKIRSNPLAQTSSLLRRVFGGRK